MNEPKLYKNKYFFVFYEYDDDTFYDVFNNVKEIVSEMKRLNTYPMKIDVDEQGNVTKTDLNKTPITRNEVQFVSTKLARSLAREKNRRHLIRLFGRLMRVYLVDINDDDEVKDLLS